MHKKSFTKKNVKKKKKVAYYMYIFSRNTEIIKLFHFVFKGQIQTFVV